jgi:pimeloyl-ACP methyl ester carboxylesterase
LTRCPGTVRAMADAPERFDVPVPGGTLAAYRWPGQGPLVVAAHGITSNHRSWGVVAEALQGEVTLVAPDLRGRGRSNELPGPYGIGRLAEDVALVIDHLGEDGAVVAGHSMGGFVAAVLAGRHPDKVRELVLVDGGLPFELPPGVEPDDAIAATLGPAMQRLDMTFEDRGAYRAFWQQHPAFAHIWSNEIDAHTQHDLIGEEPEMRSSCSKEAVTEAGREFFADDEVRTAIERVEAPLTFLWAPYGMVGDPPGLYREERVDGVENQLVPDTNHYSILLGEAGASRVAAAIRKACSP